MTTFKMGSLAVAAAVGAMMFAGTASAANILLNPGFETVDSGNPAQAADWIPTQAPPNAVVARVTQGTAHSGTANIEATATGSNGAGANANVQ